MSKVEADRLLTQLMAQADTKVDFVTLRAIVEEASVKRSAWQAVVAWLMRLALASLLIGVAVRLGLTELLGGQ